MAPEVTVTHLVAGCPGRVLPTEQHEGYCTACRQHLPGVFGPPLPGVRAVAADIAPTELAELNVLALHLRRRNEGTAA